MIQVRVRKIRDCVQLPQYQSSQASGCDVLAHLDQNLVLEPLERMLIPTGLCLEIPAGFEVQIRPRSGLAFKQGLTILNAPGTIDSDYRGEIQILVVNLGQTAVTIHPGDRIAQMVLQRTEQMAWVDSIDLEETARGTGGFGSTGIHAPTAVP